MVLGLRNFTDRTPVFAIGPLKLHVSCHCSEFPKG